jgi:type IV pilus assembly protein PilQ
MKRMESRTKKTTGYLVAGLLAATALSAPWVLAAAGRITSIDFRQADGKSLVEITSDAPLAFVKQENQADKQVILEIQDAKLSRAALRRLDTSSFPGAVSLVSPYQTGEQARVVVQLRSNAGTTVVQDGNVLRLSVADGASSDRAQASASAAEPAPSASESGESTSSRAADELLAQEEAASKPSTKASTPATLRAEEKALDDFIQSRSQRKFIGKPITLQVRDMDLGDFFQLIGEASGFNVIVGSEVQGKVTLSLQDTPWDQALDLVLSSRQLGAERRNNVLRVTTLSNLTSEKQAELAARRASEAAAPRVTRIFPISYATLADLSNVFQRFASSSGDTSGTVVQTDERTNSIIVRDTAENIERMRKLIELLDTQTPQVLIEAKVVEAKESGSKAISGTFSFGGGANSSSLTGTLGSISDIASGGNFSWGQTLNFGIGNGTRIDALLNITESQSLTRTVSSPKTVVLNKETASIVAGTPVVINTTSTNITGTLVTQTVVTANLSLNVKPTVTNDSGVLLDLTVQRDSVVPTSSTSLVAPRNIKTKVLVDSGSTLVIGGIYTSSSIESEDGIPFFRKIPIIGALFGKESKSDERTELFIFVTPRILNQKEAGLST